MDKPDTVAGIDRNRLNESFSSAEAIKAARREWTRSMREVATSTPAERLLVARRRNLIHQLWQAVEQASFCALAMKSLDHPRAEELLEALSRIDIIDKSWNQADG